MKFKIIFVWIIFSYQILMILPNMLYAQTTQVGGDVVYCPTQVECLVGGIAKDGAAVSDAFCKPDYDKYVYIDRIMHIGQYGNYKGTYNFKAAYANYNESLYPMVSEVLCQYKLADSWLNVTYKTVANLEVLNNTSSNWKIGKGINYKQNSTCYARQATECPLQTKPELVINSRVQNNKFLTVKAIANGNSINAGVTTSSHNQYLRINNDESYVACDGYSPCKIDIYYNTKDNSALHYIGNILIDLEDNMKILQVNTGKKHGSYGPYLLKKYPSFNAIQFVD